MSDKLIGFCNGLLIGMLIAFLLVAVIEII